MNGIGQFKHIIPLTTFTYVLFIQFQFHEYFRLQ